MIYKSPRDYGIPHDEWRKGQHEILLELFKHRSKFVMLEAPTGTGKSSFATGLSSQNRVLVLVHTLALLSQYERAYGFDVVRGRQEYPCVHEEKVYVWAKHNYDPPTAGDCHYPNMHDCIFSEKCPYILAKRKALMSQKAACTYRYAGVSSLMQDRGGHLVMDEAHDASEELIGFNTFSLSFDYIANMMLPMFPINNYGENNKGAVVTVDARGEIRNWIDRCLDILAPQIDETKAGSNSQNLFDKLSRISIALGECDWFLRIDKARSRTELMALSSKHVAHRIFENKDTKLLMSATIGNPKPLAKALGISDYEFISAPHPTPPAFRSITDLKMKRMTKRNLQQFPELPYVQAEAIWDWICELPENWRGLIVTPSFQKIQWLQRNLELFNRGKRRLIVQGDNGLSISDAVRKFITDVQDGDILIGTIQGLGTGLDLEGDLGRWVVIAGVPHVNPTDMYEKARREQDGGKDYQNWVTYNAVVQACGRVTRGEKTENGNWIPNFCCLADGSATTKTAMRYYPDWFKKAIK